MSKAERDEQIDADILQCKADVVRARDIMPPYKKKTSQEPKSQETSESATAAADKPSEKEETAHKDTPATQLAAVAAQQTKSEIPRFDLAEEIMAEQRKISAVRRKAPGEREELKAEPADSTVVKPAPRLSYEDKIIAEIVARDIGRLCRGNNPANSK
ncbi:MAG: hypothetical protein ACYS83_05500 [Planctomycetota bacterium]